MAKAKVKIISPPIPKTVVQAAKAGQAYLDQAKKR
jgi:hypothetical protein